MQTYADEGEVDDGIGHRGFDAVVHFAASVPAGHIPVDSETFRINVMSTYNVLEAEAKMKVEKVILASSETTYGICLTDGVVDPKWLPLDEDYPIDPVDSYGISKRVNEVTAEGFQRRTGADVYALRIGNVMDQVEVIRATGHTDHDGIARDNRNLPDTRGRDQVAIARVLVTRRSDHFSGLYRNGLVDRGDFRSRRPHRVAKPLPHRSIT